MKLSIITVCFNSETTIEECILSVLSQNYTEVEYIIIDGGSTDNTLQIIDKYKSKVSVLISEPDGGIYDAMNKGIRRSTGDVVGILNSDDVYATNDELIHIANCFYNDEKPMLVLGNVEFRNFKNNRVIRRYSARKFEPYKLRYGWMPPHPACFVRKEVYSNYGLYNTKFKISADYERFVNWIYVNKLSYKKIDRTVVHMRMGGASTASINSVITLNREIIAACKLNHLYTNGFLLLFKFPFKLLELVVVDR